MVYQLQQVHPNRPEIVAFETALAAVVDAAAASSEAVDAAYYELEDMHAKVGGRYSLHPLMTSSAMCV